MKLTFLGTGPSEAIPRKGHRDPLCTDAQKTNSKSRRTRSAVLLSKDAANMLIDAGPDILIQIQRGHIKSIDALGITHGHDDAIGGMKKLDDWLAAHQKNTEPIPCLTDERTWKRLVTRFGKFKHIKHQPIQDFNTMNIQAMRLTPFPVLHSYDPRIKTVGFASHDLIYASDFRAIPQKTQELWKNKKIAVLDAAIWFDKYAPTHMNVPDTIKLAQKLNIRHLILTQVGHSFPPHDQAQKFIRDYLKQEKISMPIKVDVAYDGMTLKIS